MTPAPARSPFLTVEAILLIVLGIVALVLPLVAGLFVATAVGVILVLSGGIGLVSALQGHAHVHRGWSILSAVIALVIGLLVVFNPLAGAVSLTLLLGAYLLLDGIALIGLAIDQRKRAAARWGWVMASGVVDIVLAVLIVTLGAIGSAVVVGVIVGIDLIAAGAALLLLHRAPMVGGFARPAV